jgi:hypothetical protein
MTVMNLAIGVTIPVERSLDLGVTNHWFRVTNFISSACASEVVEEADPAWTRAFCRVAIPSRHAAK